jgi:hypothetical protein
MRKEEVQKALNRSLSGLQADPWLAQRIIANEEEKPVKKKISVSFVFACILVVVTMSAALAVGNLLPGIREMLGLDAESGMEKKFETLDYNWETDFTTAHVREMLYDGQGAYIAIDVQKKDREDILLIPSGDRKMTLSSSAGALGRLDAVEGESIAEYAERKGMSVVYFTVMAQNLDKSFTAVTNPGDRISFGQDAWTMVLRFPAVEQNEKINVRLYTTIYDSPLSQSSLPAGERPIAEPHSITVNVPDFKNIGEQKTVMNVISVVENTPLAGLAIQDAKLIRTPIATYLDLLIGNPDRTEYSSIAATITPLGMPESEQLSIESRHFGSPVVFTEGYSSGAHEIEVYPLENITCTEFQVELITSPMSEVDELEDVQFTSAGLVTLTFGISEN